MFVFFGLYNAVLAYPRIIASYTVSVRQYQTLQFTHSIFEYLIVFVNATHFASFSAYFTVNHRSAELTPKPCDLLMFRDVTPAHKGFTPSGKI